MKKIYLFLIALSCILLLGSCVGLKPNEPDTEEDIIVDNVRAYYVKNGIGPNYILTSLKDDKVDRILYSNNSDYKLVQVVYDNDNPTNLLLCTSLSEGDIYTKKVSLNGKKATFSNSNNEYIYAEYKNDAFEFTCAGTDYFKITKQGELTSNYFKELKKEETEIGMYTSKFDSGKLILEFYKRKVECYFSDSGFNIKTFKAYGNELVEFGIDSYIISDNELSIKLNRYNEYLTKITDYSEKKAKLDSNFNITEVNNIRYTDYLSFESKEALLKTPIEEKITYSTINNVLTLTRENDSSSNAYTFDDLNRVVKYSDQYYDYDYTYGDNEITIVYTYRQYNGKSGRKITYNALGSTLTEIEFMSDINDQVSATEYQYDLNNTRIKSLTRGDSYTSLNEYTYSNSFNKEVRMSTYTSNGDVTKTKYVKEYSRENGNTYIAYNINNETSEESISKIEFEGYSNGVWTTGERKYKNSQLQESIEKTYYNDKFVKTRYTYDSEARGLNKDFSYIYDSDGKLIKEEGNITENRIVGGVSTPVTYKRIYEVEYDGNSVIKEIVTYEYDENNKEKTVFDYTGKANFKSPETKHYIYQNGNYIED